MRNKRSTYRKPSNGALKGLAIGMVVGASLACAALLGATVQHTADSNAEALRQARSVASAGVQDSGTVRNSAYGNRLTILPCLEEDSDNCVWNADSSGNGEGMSFIAYHGHVYYQETDAMDKAMGW